MRSTVNPKTSPCRIPVPAARTSRVRYRSGAAAMRAATASVDSGSTRFGCRFGSLVPSHGLVATHRSRTAAL
jgi:hypothetical protein